MVSNILHAGPSHSTVGVNRSNKTFFQSMAMLHIKLKGNFECSNMVANIVPADPHTPESGRWVEKFKIQLFQNMIILQKHKCSNMVQIFCPLFRRNSPPPPNLGVKIYLCQNNFMLHIKLKGIKNAATW